MGQIDLSRATSPSEPSQPAEFCKPSDGLEPSTPRERVPVLDQHGDTARMRVASTMHVRSLRSRRPNVYTRPDGRPGGYSRRRTRGGGAVLDLKGSMDGSSHRTRLCLQAA